MNKKSKQQPQQKQASAKSIKNAKARAKKKAKKSVLRSLAARDPRFALSWGGAGIDIPGLGSANLGNLGFTTDSYLEASHGTRSGQPTTVGLAEYTDDIQVVMPRITSSFGKRGERVDVCVGTEFMSAISNEVAGAAPGDILATLLINPSVFSQTRLVEFAKLYQRYRFRKLNFWYKPIANTTQSGQLIGFGDYDPDNILTLNSPDNISTAAAHIGQATGKLWETIRFPFGVLDDYTTLFVDTNSEEKRLSFQGVYYLLAASDIASSITALGNLYIDYEVEFSIPLLQPSQQQLSVAVIDNGTSPTLTNPMGTNPGLSAAIAHFPASTLSFSTTDLEADLYMEEDSGGFKLFNNAVSNGDIWLYTAEFSAVLTTTSVGIGISVDIIPSVSFTNAVASPVTALGQNTPGQQFVQNDTSASALLSAHAYDSVAMYVVKSVNNLPIESDYSIAVGPSSSNWSLIGTRLVVQRLYRGTATPGALMAPLSFGTLDHLRKREMHKRQKRLKMAIAKDEEESAARKLNGYKVGPNDELMLKLLDMLSSRSPCEGIREEPFTVISRRSPDWVPLDDEKTDRESQPRHQHNDLLIKRR